MTVPADEKGFIFKFWNLAGNFIVYPQEWDPVAAFKLRCAVISDCLLDPRGIIANTTIILIQVQLTIDR